MGTIKYYKGDDSAYGTVKQTANEMRQLYLSCPPEARKVLLNSTRALADELKRMVQITDPDADIDLESK